MEKGELPIRPKGRDKGIMVYSRGPFGGALDRLTLGSRSST